MNHSPLPWSVDSEDAGGEPLHYEIFDANGKVILDTYNSQTACIMQEDSKPWDEQGRVDTALIVKAVNCHAELVECCTSAIAALKVLETMCDRVSLTSGSATAVAIREDIEAILKKAKLVAA